MAEEPMQEEPEGSHPGVKRRYSLVVWAVVTFSLIVLGLYIYTHRMSGHQSGQLGGEGSAQSVTEWPVGVTVFDPSQAYNGFTLFTSLGGDGTHHLIDMHGTTVHTWEMPPSHYGWLLPSGNLLSGAARQAGLGTATTETPAVANVGSVYEADWNGNIVQEWRHTSLHHDYDKMPNGSILALLWSEHKRPDEVLGGIPNTEYRGGVILSETIVEIDSAGQIAWEWVAEDHLEAGEYPICPLDYRKRWLHANSIQFLL